MKRSINDLVRPQESGSVRDLNQAWDLYYHVFRRISRQLPQLTSLELQYVSPRLLNCRDLELAVPGSYVPDQDLIRIAHIQSSLQVNILYHHYWVYDSIHKLQEASS